MDKTTILLILSLIGVFSLLLIINTKQPIQTSISSISEKQINKNVQIIGKLSNIKNYDNDFSVLSIKDENNKEIQVICNCNKISESLKESQSKNKTLTITGKVQVYQNNLQINADKIKLN